MKKYNGLRLKLGAIVLSKLRKKNKRKVKICPLSKAKTVGVTFVVRSKNELKEVKQVLKVFANKGLETYALGYIPEKKADDYFLSQQAFNFFYDKELDFFLRPKSEAANEFQQQSFDLLIDLNTFTYFPMKYLLENSAAGYKVGYFNEENDGPFDLMLQIDPKQSLEYMAEQVIHYLSMLKD
jgi:hypothetical protein